MISVDKEINPRFENFVFDWNYQTYLLFGGYGSSKSYHIALKIILKLLEEKRKCLVVREVYETIRESCFDLFREIVDDLGLLAVNNKQRNKIQFRESPMKIIFPNGSQIIFKGMDKTEKMKSMNGVSIVWVEEASEVKYAGYKELIGRLRHPTLKMFFFLSWNPVDEQNWTYKHFFIDKRQEKITLDPEVVYKHKTVVKDGVYYHHSVPTDNLFLPQQYLDNLMELQEYDPDLWRVAWEGRYGANGTRVLPQLLRSDAELVNKQVSLIPQQFHFIGMDFGFETSYNAIVRMAVDEPTNTLFVYWEYYKNKMTDEQTAAEIQELKPYLITADNEDPKAIKYYNLQGFRMRACKKFAGSRLSNIKKCKRFKRIVISTDCPNCWDELKDLTYKKNPRTDEMVYDQFNIDPHTFSAIWYGLDSYYPRNLKDRNSTKRS